MRNGVVLLYVPTYCLMWILIELEFWFTKNANPTHTYPHIHREKQTPTPTKSKKKINNLKKKMQKGIHIRGQFKWKFKYRNEF